MKKIIAQRAVLPITRALVATAVGAAFAGCTVQPVVYEHPAPRVVYEAPAPNATVTVQVEPPPLPVYEQPPCPEPGFIWTPGYWAWAGNEYYWVPGTWVQPPRVGVYWTPAYWGWVGGSYVFHGGYWGPHVGFYGGINYGFGYVGVGFVGGRWDEGGRFAYNTAVTNVNTTVVRNTYNVTVVNNTTVNNTTVNNTVNNNVTNNVTNNRTSVSGGPHGVQAAPTAAEMAAANEAHVAPTREQISHVQLAAQNPALLHSANQGHPTIAATPKPAVFTAPGVVAARPPAGVHPMTAPTTPTPVHSSPTAPTSAVNHAPPPPPPPAPVVNHAAPPPPPAPVVNHAAPPPPPAPVVNHAPPPPPPHPAPAPKSAPKPAEPKGEREHGEGKR